MVEGLDEKHYAVAEQFTRDIQERIARPIGGTGVRASELSSGEIIQPEAS